MWFYIIGIIIYFIIVMVAIEERTVWFRCDENFKIIEGHRDASTKDAWLSLIWPVTLLIYMFKLTIWAVNEIVILPCLLVGFRYKETKIYRRLEKLI